MSGWRIVPVATTQDMTVAAYDAEADDFTTMYEAALAAAPEPDWQSITDAVIADYCDQGCVAPRHDALMRALKATFGSKP